MTSEPNRVLRPAVVLAVTVLSAAPMACASVESPLQAVPAAIRVQLAVASVRLPAPSELRRGVAHGSAHFGHCLPDLRGAACEAAPTESLPDLTATAFSQGGPPQVPLHHPMLSSRPSRAP